MIISPLLPEIGRTLSIDDAVLGTLVSAYSLMVGLFAILSGPVSDRIGRRRMLLLGTGTMTLALAAHQAVDSYASFLAVRVFAGIAGGMLSGAAVSYVGDYFPYERRGWATGWVMSGSAFGQIAGVPLGVILADHFGFRAPFAMFAVAMALTFLLIFTRVPQPDVRRTRSLTLASAIAGYADMLRRREIVSAAAAYFTMFMGVAFFVVYLPTWLERALGATPSQIAALFLVGGVANVLTGPRAGHLSDRVGRKRIILGSCVGLSIVMALTTVVTVDMWVAYPMFFLTMVLVAMRISPFSALLTALVSDERRGSLMSFAVALGQVGFAVGAAAAGPLFSAYGYASTTWLAGVFVLAMGVIVWFRIPEPAVPSTAPMS
ncbi:MAG: MFS transporter [Gemmatimonadetes bacterium]|nr:MAG: MFS transporter [Gemmatimonadota bacterium]